MILVEGKRKTAIIAQKQRKKEGKWQGKKDI